MRSRGFIAVGLIAAGLVIAIVLLALQVGTEPEVELDEDKLAQARAYHAQLERQAERAAAAAARPSIEPPIRREPKPAARSAPDTARGRPDDDEGIVKVDPDPPRVRAPRQLAEAVQLKQVGEPGEGGKEIRMDNANGMYDRGDYEGSRAAALDILAEDPNNVRMLRIVVSSSCIMGEPDMAREYFERLERPRDLRQMAARCNHYGVELEP